MVASKKVLLGHPERPFSGARGRVAPPMQFFSTSCFGKEIARRILYGGEDVKFRVSLS